MDLLSGIILGFFLWFLIRIVVMGIYTVNQNERAVKTVFGRAERINGRTTLDDPIAEHLREEERGRYSYPQVRVIGPGGRRVDSGGTHHPDGDSHAVAISLPSR